ncbi:hypothetical protein BTO28_10745 [Domibacillus epiphyticus]|uniref:Uncharacterized protein n=1 Tax=Domibacillus epiphyticus TaxID=1714355 RepID=A0A1V2A6B5_9BACI|nr:hypothetical protein BTO28_10745 [Domibacillus epiphyticus]
MINTEFYTRGDSPKGKTSEKNCQPGAPVKEIAEIIYLLPEKVGSNVKKTAFRGRFFLTVIQREYGMYFSNVSRLNRLLVYYFKCF